MTGDENIKDIYSLAPLQEGFLFHWLLDESSSTYFDQVEYTLIGKIDVDLLEMSVNKIIERYDILRTIYIYEKVKTPIQVVLKKRTAKIHFEDISHLNGEEQKSDYIKRFRQKDREKGCDLSKDLLTRIALFHWGENQNRLIWSSHHILMDAWCMEILYRELEQVYVSLKKGKPLQLEPVIPYKNYIQWLEQQDKDEGLRYWREYLQGFDTPAVVPGLNNKGNNKKSQLVRYDYTIEPLLSDGLLNISRKNNVTANTIFQTIWGILLQEYNNVEDVAYGTVASGRPADLDGIEKMVGFFMNTIPVRIKLGNDRGFSRLLRRVQRQEILSKSYEYFPLAEVQSCSTLKKDLINHVMVFESRPVMTGRQEKSKNHAIKENKSNPTPFDFTSVNVESFHQINYDFALVIIPQNPFRMALYFEPSAYEGDFINNIAMHIIEAIKQVVKQPDIDVRNIEVLSKEEKKKLLDDFNRTSTDYPKDKTIRELYEELVEKVPDKIALVGMAHSLPGPAALTYGELNIKSNRLARLLRARGVKPDTIVGIMLPRSLEMIVGILAVLKANGAYLPIDNENPPKRIKYMLDDGNTPLLLTQNSVIEKHSFIDLQGPRTPGAKVHRTMIRKQITDLEKDLPIPDRSLVSYEKYSSDIGLALAKNTIAVQASRGCPYKCIYCHKIWPKTHIFRSAEHIFSEIKLYYNMGVRRFSFFDDIFNLNVKNSMKFFKLIIKNKLGARFFFPNGLRGDLLTRDYIDLMVEAGTIHLGMSLETASPRLQKAIKKNLNVDKLHQNMAYICERYPQVITELFTMHGFPTETEEEAQMTLDFIKSLKWVHLPLFNILKIYPNTEMADFAQENGICAEAINISENLAFHELPETLPFDKNFTLKCQADFLDYMLSKERLTHVLPHQMKVLTMDEMIQKYNSYLPAEIKRLDDLLKLAGISRQELPPVPLLDENYMKAPDLDKKMKMHFPAPGKDQNALKILLIDVSRFFSGECDMLYDVNEPPLGLIYLLTYLNKTYGSRVKGKIVKSRTDFDGYAELKSLLTDFKPELIGIRSLTFFNQFFHKTAAMIRHWGFDVPIIAGGPYATSDYKRILQDKNVDLVVLGEGEITFSEFVGKMMENNGKMPGEKVLKEIPGIAFVPGKEKQTDACAREIIMMDELSPLLIKGSGMNWQPGSQPGRLAYTMYTSDSTGQPKAVLVNQQNVVRLVKNTNFISLKQGDHLLQTAPLEFDASTFETWGSLLNGLSLFLTTESSILNPDDLKEMISKNKIDLMWMTSPLFNQVLEIDIEIFSGLKHIIIGGDALSSPHINRLKNRYPRLKIINGYGPTENTTFSTAYLIEREYETRIPIGRPIANSTAYILDKNKNLVPIGAAGELWVGGDGAARGYLNNPELTRQKFMPNPFVKGDVLYGTGDKTRWLPDGSIDFLGRLDTQVKIRGIRIELEEIESHLLSHRDINDAIVTAGESEPGKKELKAFVVCGKSFELSELKRFLAGKLPDYMIPSYFLQIDNIPLTTNGKVDRKVLFEKGKRVRGSEQYQAPRLEMERQIAAVWEQVLDVKPEEIGIYDNFFDLGGDSIKVIQVRSRLNQCFKKDIKITLLFEYPTIHSLVQYLRLEQGDEAIDRTHELDKGKEKLRQRLNKRKRN
jgi:amino acid adenylation domain-containing protein